ncbi:MAG: hypothetical protein DPW18_09520 [Chloroflexi bacterium]|nr:hypothetical protein [Chloroflexota bacterium]MDL1941763.1 hypothetical protein [Chloroflexi bacterium CFX2]
MQRPTEEKRAKAAYNWLQLSPLLTVPTLFFFASSGLGYTAVEAICPACGFEIAEALTAVTAVLGSALWHLFLLQYVNYKGSEFVRKHGRQALGYAGVRTAVALIGAFLAVLGGTEVFSCLAVIVLVVLWATQSRTGLKQIKMEMEQEETLAAQMEETMYTPEQAREILRQILEDLQSGDDVTVLLAIEKLAVFDRIDDDILEKAILRELEICAGEDDNMDIRMDARIALDRLRGAEPSINAAGTDAQTPANAAQSPQEIVAQIHQRLQSTDEAVILRAIASMKTLPYSSEAIRSQLEKLSLHGSSPEVRAEALAALDTSANRAVRRQVAGDRLSWGVRNLILGEIDAWVKSNLINNQTGDVLRRRYDFDIAPQPKAAPQTPPKPAPIQPAAPAPKATPAPAPTPVTPPEPRPTLLQTLTSEASIKIYLYLGAFFVIAAAAILGAVVPELRLPILILGTFIFGGLAVLIKKRLPQPSFALFIVFSFLLVITANSLEQSLRFAFEYGKPMTAGYWVIVFLIMSVIWSGGTWLYESRLFSITAFGSLALAMYRAGGVFDAQAEFHILMEGIAALAGLTGASLLTRWRDAKFALPLFLAAQALQVAALVVSISIFGAHVFDPSNPNLWHLAGFLTWGLAGIFYTFSNGLRPFFAFPWLAAGALIPMPWFLAAAFDLESLGSSMLFFGWGFMLASASEALHRIERARTFSLPVLLASMPSLALAFMAGIVFETWLGMLAALVTAMLFTALHTFRLRWWLWSLALLNFIAAYFSFFLLDFMQALDVFFGYQLLGMSLLFLLPDLLLKKDWQADPEWRLPPRIAGALFAACNLLFLLFPFDSTGSAICYGIYAVFFAVYALAYSKPLLGYIPAAALPLAILFALDALEMDAWLPALTALAVLYLLAGLGIRAREGWAFMLRNSALILGSIVSIAALIALKETGGWYALAAGLLFAVEMYLRKNGWFEIGAPILFTAGAFLILRGFDVSSTNYHLLAYSLLWVLADLLAHLTFTNPRPLNPIVRGIGAALTGVNFVLIPALAPASEAAICCGVYTIVFTVYALAYRLPLLGYVPAASLALTSIFILEYFSVDAWLPTLTALAIGYFLAGMAVRAREGWSLMLRNSALVLGAITAFAALIALEETGGWYALAIGLLFIAEMYLRKNGWFEAGAPILFTVGAFLILRDFNVQCPAFHLLAYSLLWILADLLAHLTFTNPRPLNWAVRIAGGSLALANYGFLFFDKDAAVGASGFAVYSLLFLTVSLLYRQPNLFYTFTLTLPLFAAFLFRSFDVTQWIHPVIAAAAFHYAAGFVLQKRGRAAGWDAVLMRSGLGLGVVVSAGAPILGGLDASLPVAAAATLWAVEAYAKRSAWLAFPANGLYLLAYFIILFELDVTEPQFFSIGTALFGLIQHYLLTRAGGRTGAFIMGMFSQFVLLGTTYIEMVGKNELLYFFALFLQSLAVLTYGIIVRSRSLTFFPIGFVVLGVVTVVYSALKDIGSIFLIGCTGIILLMLGVIAVLLRERIAKLGETLSEWRA